MRPDPRCIIDRARPCRGCIASSPIDCPYPYLLAEPDADDDPDLDLDLGDPDPVAVAPAQRS